MIRGIESFTDWFRGYEDYYAIISGTACDLLMTDGGLDFRATKDIDLVLITQYSRHCRSPRTFPVCPQYCSMKIITNFCFMEGSM